MRQTTNAKDTKEPVVAGAVDFAPLESDKAESGDKESLSRVVQAKMAVSSPSDPFEVEAEKVAADFVKRSYNPGSGDGVGISRSITPLVARRASGDGLENSGAGLETSAEAALKISRATASGGRPLDGATRSRFEDGLGADLSAVKVHTDSSSDTLCRSLSADAFSTGRDVFFSSGTFSPGTKSGDHLLAHELTHVVQQGAAPTVARSKASASAGQAEEGSVFRLTVGRANDPSEDLADAMADDAVASLRRSASRPGTVHRKAADSKDPLGGTQVDDGIERSINSQRGKGAKLGDREAAHFSESYGTDLSGVRVHTDSTADALSRSLQAKAFTTGSDVFFSKGSYKPGTADGDHLIGHELAHVASAAGAGGGAQRVMRLFDDRVPVFASMTSSETFLKDVPSVAGWVTGSDPPQREALAKLLKDYRTLTKGLALQVNQLDQGLTLLNGMVTVTESYFADEKLKKDQKQSEPLKKFLEIVKKAQTDVQSRRLDKGRKEEVKESDIGNKFKKHDPKDHITLFSKVGMLLGENVEEDESIEFEVELDIPIGATKLTGKLAVSAEYGGGMYKARAAVSVGGGGKIPYIGEITAALGGYLEAQSKDARLTGDLLGYALYRRLAESSVVPAEVQYYLFGTAGKDGKESSEANMLAVEMAAFGGEDSDENYSESGGFLEIAGEVGKAGVSASGTAGTRTDKKSLEMNKMKAGEKKEKQSGLVSQLTGGSRGAEKSTGRTIGGFNVKIELPKPLKAEGEYQIRWIEEGEGVVGVDTHELAIQIVIPKKMHDSASKMKEVMTMIMTIVQGKAAMAEAKTKKEKSQVFVTETMGPLLEQVSEQAQDKAKEAVQDYVMENAAVKAGTDMLKKAVGYKSKEEQAIAITCDITNDTGDVSFVESETKSVNVLGLKASMKKSSKTEIYSEEEEEEK